MPFPRHDLADVQPPPREMFNRAVKYRYDASKLDTSTRWESEETLVNWTKIQVGSGGMRDCFLVWECDPHSGTPTQMVGKVFQADVGATLDDYMNEAITQCVADTFAQAYNKLGTEHKVSFLGCYVVKMIDCPGVPKGETVAFTMEPMLRGIYEKHNNNVGKVFTSNQTAEAFTHFTFLHSDRKLVVCDLQGVGGMYTDPQIHSLDGEEFGLGNLGEDGIRKWMAGHKCCPLCTALGFTPVSGLSNAESTSAPPRLRPFNAYGLVLDMKNTFRKHGEPNVGIAQPMGRPAKFAGIETIEQRHRRLKHIQNELRNKNEPKHEDHTRARTQQPRTMHHQHRRRSSVDVPTERGEGGERHHQRRRPSQEASSRHRDFTAEEQEAASNQNHVHGDERRRSRQVSDRAPEDAISKAVAESIRYHDEERRRQKSREEEELRRAIAISLGTS
ncbi:Myosin heavy chain kinase A [Diplonema papillatum]|nr:Myosin heavy chain kinase A [Diplonema papillatum]